MWCPTPRRHPLLASRQETAVRWVIIIETWYKPPAGFECVRAAIDLKLLRRQFRALVAHLIEQTVESMGLVDRTVLVTQ